MKDMGLDWCYLAMPCEAKNLEVIAKTLLNLNCQGLNITIPHKQNIIKSCNNISPLAKRLGAVNTLIPNKEGGWDGMNTDVEGFLAPLKGKNWNQSKAIVLGCGGSARAVIAGLQNLNISQITVIARREYSLNNCLTYFKKNILESETNSTLLKGLLTTSKNIDRLVEEAELIINTTPVGMSSSNISNNHLSQLPLGEKIWNHLRPKTILYDLIYTPRPTAWLTLGKQHGCEIIDGLEMLIQQGAASLRLWSKNDKIPVDLMRLAAEKYLTT